MLVISVRELWLPPLRGPHIHTSIHVHCPTGTNTRGPSGLHVCSEMTVTAYMRSYERDAETASGENREKFRTKESRRKKIVRAITHPLDTWESGIPLASQTSFLSLGGSKFFTRNELISFFRKKENSPDDAPCLGVRSVE